MKALLKDPLILTLLLVAGLLYIIVAFNYIGKNRKYVDLLEKLYICFFLITIAGESGATLAIFGKLNPRTLVSHAITPPTVIGQLGIYATALLLLSSRLRYTLRDLVPVFTALLTRDPFLLTFLGLMGFSVFWSDTPIVTLKTSAVYLEVVVFAIYVGKQYSWKELFQLARWTTLAIIVLSLVLGEKDGDGAWVGIIGHKNHFCFQMLFSALVWFVNSLYDRKQRKLSLFLTLLSLILLNQGGSGAAKVLFITLFSLWFYLGFVKRLSPQWAFVSVLLFMIASVCLTIIVTENLEFIVVDTLNKDLTLTGRTEFWPLVIDNINQRPLLGYGIGGFWQPWRGIENPARDIIVLKSKFVPPHSHNGFMDIACDLGYLGVSIFIISFVSSLAKAVMYLGRSKMPEAGLPILVLSFILMTNLTETGLVGVTSIWFWYIVVAVRTSLDAAQVVSVRRKDLKQTVLASR